MGTQVDKMDQAIPAMKEIIEEMPVSEDLMQGAMKLAQTIALKSPLAINIAKKSLIYSRDHTV